MLPGISHAEPDVPNTRFEMGLSVEAGAFGIEGDYARRERAEGGGVFRIPFHIRITEWEGSAHFFFAGGAADNDTFDTYGTSGFGFSLKRYLPLSASASGYGRRRTVVRWDAYIRGGFDRLRVNRPDDHTATSLSYGLGLKMRLQSGRRGKAKLGYGFYLDLGRTRPISGPQDDSTLQTLTFGFTFPGVSI